LNFILEVVKKKITIMEIGCGGGYFIKSCELKNIIADGYDINKI